MQRSSSKHATAFCGLAAALCAAMWFVPGAVAATTSITTVGHVAGGYQYRPTTTDGGPTTVVSPAHRWEWDASDSVTPGALDGQGVADFGALKVRVLVDGLSAEDGGCTAAATDYWTVNHPQLQGTTGTMQLAFAVTGTATVLDYLNQPLTGNDSFARVHLNVAIDDTPVLAMQQPVAHGPVAFAPVAGSPSVSDPFTFTYGTPFKIHTWLRVFGDPDNHYLRTQFSPFFFTFYGGGTVSRIDLDFANSAELSAIVIPGSDGQAQLQTQSGADHQSLLAGDLIPEPASAALLAIGGLALVARRRGDRRGRSYP